MLLKGLILWDWIFFNSLISAFLSIRALSVWSYFMPRILEESTHFKTVFRANFRSLIILALSPWTTSLYQLALTLFIWDNLIFSKIPTIYLSFISKSLHLSFVGSPSAYWLLSFSQKNYLTKSQFSSAIFTVHQFSWL